MKFQHTLAICFMVCGFAINSAPAQQPSAQEGLAEPDGQAAADAQAAPADDLQQLRELREALVEAVIAGDVDKQIEYVRDDVVTVWQNNQVAAGHEGLRSMLSQVNPGGENIFRGYTERPSSDDVTILPSGDVALAHGKSTPHYKWLGLEFDLENRWTATLIKTDGKWKIASYHVSGNLIDNPVLDAAKQSVYIASALALLVGVILGALGSRLMKKRTGPQSA